MEPRIHIISQDDEEEELTMVNRPGPFAREVTPPKKLVQLNLFGEVIVEPPQKPTRTVDVRAHTNNGAAVRAHTREIAICAPKSAVKKTKKSKKASKFRKTRVFNADEKLALKLHHEQLMEYLASKKK